MRPLLSAALAASLSLFAASVALSSGALLHNASPIILHQVPQHHGIHVSTPRCTRRRPRTSLATRPPSPTGPKTLVLHACAKVGLARRDRKTQIWGPPSA